MVVGIDPGIKGALAILNKNGFAEAFPMPMVGKAIDIILIADWLRNFQTYDGIQLAICEKARGMPGQGITSTCTFCRGYGIILGILGTLKIPVVEITSQRWKKKILAGTKRDKYAAIEYVRKRYPKIDLKPGRKKKPHDGIADSICIAEYGLQI